MPNNAIAWECIEISGYALIPPNTTLGVIYLDNMYKLDIIATPIPHNTKSSEDGRKQ